MKRDATKRNTSSERNAMKRDATKRNISSEQNAKKRNASSERNSKKHLHISLLMRLITDPIRYVSQNFISNLMSSLHSIFKPSYNVSYILIILF